MSEKLNWKQLKERGEKLRDEEAMKIGKFILDRCDKISTFDDLDYCSITIFESSFLQTDNEDQVKFVDLSKEVSEKEMTESERQAKLIENMSSKIEALSSRITAFRFYMSELIGNKLKIESLDNDCDELIERLAEPEKYDKISEETIKNYQEESLLEGDADSLGLDPQSFDSESTSFDSDEISE